MNTTVLLIASCVCCVAIAASATPDAPVIALGESADDAPRLHLFPLTDGDIPTPAVLVCPGGGYAHLAMDYEGTEVAEWLNANGVGAFVLEYRVAPHRHPAPLEDVERALRLIRERAGEWNVDPARVGVLGFSAGGHLAASASTLLKNDEKTQGVSARPDFSILIYPVIAFLPPFGHTGSGENLLGANATPELIASFSLHERVDQDTPPAFLVHSSGDSVVPSENSIAYYLALKQAGVPAEMHIFEQGEHGYGMGKGDPVLSTWTGLCIQWLEKRGILRP